MGRIRQLFEEGNIIGCESHIHLLWAARRSSDAFTASDAGDAAWLFDRTQGSTALQRQLWPKLLGLLSRWAFVVSRTGPSGPVGRSTGAVTFLRALQRWLAALLPSSSVPWSVRAPALLLIAVVGCTPHEPGDAAASTQETPAAASPLPLAAEVLRAQLQRRRPSADLLAGPPDAVADLCTAVELVSERYAAEGDCRVVSGLMTALLATLGGALTDMCSGLMASAAVATASTPHHPPSVPSSQPLSSQQQQEQQQQQSGSTRLVLSLAAAAVQEAAAAALAALHASCRQIGSALARAAAVAAATDTVSVPSAPGDARLTQEGKAMPSTAGAAAVAAAPAAWLTLGARHLHDTAVAAAAAAAAVASTAAQSTDPTIDPWAVLSVTAAAASGLIEGYILTVRLQPLGWPQELLLQLLQPSWDLLSDTLQAAAAAAAAASGTGAALRTEPSPSSPGAIHSGPRVGALDMALGYGWSRLRSHSPLPAVLQTAVDLVVGKMAAPAAAPAAGGERDAGAVTPRGPDGGDGGGPWHPARGALAVLLLGSLGVGRVLQLAAKGTPAEDAAAGELLEGHRQGPLFADTQLLAKAVVGALTPRTKAGVAETAAAAPERRGLPAAAAAEAALARAVLDDAAAAARRLHVLYGGVADSAAGRAWLAALPAAATGALREVLDRVFVCQVSVLATAYGVLAAAPPPAALRDLDVASSDLDGRTAGGEVAAAAAAAAAAAVTALAALADLQFCALQLRAHGELVSRLNAAVTAAPAAALPPLLALLPCYPTFAAAYADGGGGFASAPVAASRLAFLLPLASSHAPYAADPAEASYVVLPYIFLLFKDAPEAVIQAAHATWAALLAGLSEGSSGGGGDEPAAAGGPQRRGRQAQVALAASMVPYYLDRTFQEPCSGADVEMLEWGLRQVLQALPGSHPVKAWSGLRLTRQLADWAGPSAAAAAAAAASGPSPGTSSAVQPQPQPQSAQSSGGDRDSGGPTRGQERGGAPKPGTLDPGLSTKPPGDPAATAQQRLRRLALVVGGFMAAVDFPLLPQALGALGEVLLRGLGPDAADARRVVLQQLHDCWLGCSDYARKQLLEQWFRSTLGGLGIRAKL